MASAHATAPDPTSVYRYYDGTDMLIYVGITRQGIGRNVQHNTSAEWWPHVTRQEVEHHVDRASAAAREKELIRQYRPPFNRQHNLGHAELRAAYLAFATGSTKDETPKQQYDRLKKRLPLDVVDFDGRRLVLRSHLEHAPLASAIQLIKEVAPVRSSRRIGALMSAEILGPFAVFTCAIKKHTVPVESVESARAFLGWSQQTKPMYPWVRQILVDEAV